MYNQSPGVFDVRRKLGGVVVALAAALTGTVLLAPPANAVANNTVAFYSMDEPPGSTVLVDNSGNGRNGTIGAEDVLGATYQGATGHRYSTVLPGEMQAHPEHTDKVPHHASLNPDSGDFSVTLRFRTTYKFGNIVQKGQGTAVGGYWKIENPEGLPRCLFRGGNGSSRTGYSTVAVDDGQWHILRCVRTSAYVEMYIDGVRQSRLNGSSGNIANSAQMSIGGKSQCDGTETTCDYFVGDIDYLRIEKGTTAVQNAVPNANAGVSCTGLICNLSGAGSTDSDGAIQRYQWDFGDGQTFDGQSIKTTTHKYDAAGTYNVTLTVTDDRGATDTDTRSVTVAPIPEKISFVGQSTSNNNALSHQVTVPGAVQAGDMMLLFFSQNNAASRTAPAGWTERDTLAGGYGRTTVYSRVATAGDAGNTVAIGLSQQAKANLVLSAYRGTDGTVAALTKATETSSLSTRVTPNATVGSAQSWGVSYWMHGDAASTQLTPPADVTVRSNGSQTGGGRVTGLLADSAASLPVGTYGGLSATGAAASTTGTTWTVILRPADGPPPPNQDPTASFTTSCTGLSCSVNAGASGDNDGSIVNYAWSWGDTTSSNGASPTTSHPYAAAGTYTIGLTVTDDDGATASTTRQVTVDEAPPNPNVIGFVNANVGSTTTANHTVTIPGQVQPGDTLLLFLSLAELGTPTAPGGWQQVGNRDDEKLRTVVWSRVAQAGDAGSVVTVPVSTSLKGTLTVAAYRGVAPITAFASTAATGDSANRTTPTVGVSAASSWAVSYWAHRDSSTTTLSVPGGVTSRGAGTQSGGGHVTTLLADSGANVTVGNYGGLTSTAQAASSYGVTWTVVLAPAP